MRRFRNWNLSARLAHLPSARYYVNNLLQWPDGFAQSSSNHVGNRWMSFRQFLKR
jgi:hypothetical protein